MRQARGDPAWARDPRFDTSQGRWEHRMEMDRHIAAWTAHLDSYDAFHTLQRAGVAAGPVLNGKDLLLDPHLQARGFFERATSAAERVGTRVYPGRPYHLSRTPGSAEPPSPFGQDNGYVLRELLGLSDAEVAGLVEQGIVAAVPDPGEQESPEWEPPQAQLRRHAIQLYDPDYKQVLGLQ